MKKKNKGRTSGGYAQIVFHQLCWHMGWECSVPTFETYPYDFVVRGIEKETKFKTVQVKQAYTAKGSSRIRVDIRKKGKQGRKRAYEKGDFDYAAVYRPDNDEWYVIPWSKIRNIKSEIGLTLGKWDGYKIKKRTSPAKV
tara:strand:+ start:3384 stop:3803 length:420 start_codon:yes stop_codon:yes gene_type:complete